MSAPRGGTARDAVFQGYLSTPNRQDAPSPVLLCQERDNLSAFCSTLTLQRFLCNLQPQKVRLLD